MRLTSAIAMLVACGAPALEPALGVSQMTSPRAYPTMTPLPSGKVLVAGGSTAAAELYDPATGPWTATGSMSEARRNPGAVLLPDGEVLIAGGLVCADAGPLLGSETPTSYCGTTRSDCWHPIDIAERFHAPD